MPSTKVGEHVPLPSITGVTHNVNAASVRLDMPLPCGLPESKAGSLLPWGTIALLTSIYATTIVGCGRVKESVTIAREHKHRYPFWTRLRH